MASLSLWFSQRVLSYAVCFHQENVRARAVASLSLRLFIPRAGGRVLCRRRRMVSAGGAMLEGSDHSGSRTGAGGASPPSHKGDLAVRITRP